MKLFILKRFPEVKTSDLIKKCFKKAFKTKCEVIYKKSGKPFLNKDIFVGVTHTDELVLIAFNKFNFGIDAEIKGRKIKNKEKILDKFFSENEKQENFLEIWVKKEALIKFYELALKDMKSVDTSRTKGNFTKIEYMDHLIYIYSETEITQICIDDEEIL